MIYKYFNFSKILKVKCSNILLTSVLEFQQINRKFLQLRIMKYLPSESVCILKLFFHGVFFFSLHYRSKLIKLYKNANLFIYLFIF